MLNWPDAAIERTEGGASDAPARPKLVLHQRPGGEHDVEQTAYTTRIQDFVSWGRKNSLWPMPMGLACCAIELMATVGPRYDLARFGAEALRFSPRQADMMVVSGTVTKKMAPAVRKIYDRCQSALGHRHGRLRLLGRDVPLVLRGAGRGRDPARRRLHQRLPPRPEALIEAVLEIQRKLERGERSASELASESSSAA